MIGNGAKIVAAGLLAGILASTAPVKAQDLQTAPLDRRALTDLGFQDPTLLLVLNSKGELVGALTEDHPNDPSNGRTRKLAPGRMPQHLTGRQANWINLSILPYQGSNCYVVNRDGTLYVMPQGCQ
jgi:hypothetical protein